MDRNNLVSGQQGELAACEFLRKQGYKILQRNFKIRYGEIDIIVIDKDSLVFVEVKTRSSSEFGSPLEAITYWKLKSLIKTAQFYKLSHPKTPELMRIDAISVVLNSNNTVASIDHIKNISGF